MISEKTETYNARIESVCCLLDHAQSNINRIIESLPACEARDVLTGLKGSVGQINRVILLQRIPF
jgi:hypothetical protein